MKGIIVENKGKYAVALTKNGDFVKTISRKGYEVGCEVDFSPATQLNTRFMTRIASVAAAFILVFGISFGVYAMPYSYVDMDINPSVELTTNIFDRIIAVEALNTDGEKLTSEEKLKNLKLEDGIAKLLNKAVEAGYIKAGDLEAVVFSVSSGDKVKSKKLEAKVQEMVKTEFADSNEEAVVMVEKYSTEKQKEARENGISPGKLTLIERLIEQNPEMNVNELKDATVKDIMKSIKQGKLDAKSDGSTKESTSGSKAKNNDNSKGNSKGSSTDKSQNQKFQNGADSDIGKNSDTSMKTVKSADKSAKVKTDVKTGADKKIN